MTISHSPITFAPLDLARRLWVAVGALAITATLAACSPSVGDEPASTGAQPGATEDVATEDSDTPDETSSEDSIGDKREGEAGTPSAPDAGSYTTDDVGNGTLNVDGVEFPDFTGDCEISRHHGKEDVGDLNEGDISAIIAVDNVKAHEDNSMNYIAINEEEFRFSDALGAAGVGGPRNKGEITAMTELGPRTADGSRDIVEVRFAGVLEDGTEVDADIVCELQNSF